MGSELRYTLVTDGSSDAAFLYVLNWLLRQHAEDVAIQPAWADLRRLNPPVKSLTERIQAGYRNYPCDLLFIHRDAERQSRESRIDEIRNAIAPLTLPPFICVIPIRMQETWLLFNAQAIRQAAGNPIGRQPLALPPLNTLETLPQPKETLYQALQLASGRSGRRAKKFNVYTAVHRVAELIDDYAPLRALTAFRALETDIQNFITTLH